MFFLIYFQSEHTRLDKARQSSNGRESYCAASEDRTNNQQIWRRSTHLFAGETQRADSKEDGGQCEHFSFTLFFPLLASLIFNYTCFQFVSSFLQV